MNTIDIFRIAFIAVFIALTLLPGFRTRVNDPVQIPGTGETEDPSTSSPLQPFKDDAYNKRFNNVVSNKENILEKEEATAMKV